MSAAAVRTIDLWKLTEGKIPALTIGAGLNMFEACLVCLEDQRHVSGVELQVSGTFPGVFKLVWPDSVTDNMRRYWRDESEATEYAAYGLSLLLIEELTGYTALERTNRGPGFDFWLGYYDEVGLPAPTVQSEI